MRKKIIIMTFLLTLMITSLVFAYPDYDLNNTYTNINIGSIGSTTYSVPWNARTTATETADIVKVTSSIYFNGTLKASSLKSNYNSTTVYDYGTVTGNVGPKGTWLIIGTHKVEPMMEYMTSDSVYYDPGI